MLDDGRALAEGYAIPPAFSVAGDGAEPITAFRWRWDGSQSSGVIRYALSSYLLSLVLQPMNVDAWFEGEKIFSGHIAGDCLRLTPPGAFAWQSHGPCDFLQLVIPVALVERLADPALLSARLMPDGRTHYLADPVAAAVGRQLIQIAGENGRLQPELSQALSYALLVRMLDRYEAGPARDPALSTQRLQRVFRFMEAKLDEDISVDDLAGVAALSVSHFANAFRATTGIPPHRYLMKLRIDRARALLQDERRSVLAVALDCGFKDASHFARVFREHAGMSPRAFRKRPH